MLTLRPYQEQMLAEVRAHLRAGLRRVLMVAPCGAGKGSTACRIVQGAAALNKRVLFLVNRRGLVEDMSRRLDRLNMDHGVIMADHPRRKPWLNVHVASIDTLRNRASKPPADILIADEAHFAVSKSWIKTFELYPDAAVIGMTATPARLDGRGLGRVFQAMVMGPTVEDLTAEGFLVPVKAYGPPAGLPDLSGVHKSHGEYNQKQLAVATNRPRLVGDIVQHWLQIARGLPTIVFAVDIAHSMKIRDAFREAGINSEHADADTPSRERNRLWEDLLARRVPVVTSVGIVSYGWDVPGCVCAVLARPTTSVTLYLQQIGRVLRPAPGKEYALVLDHAGNIHQHGAVDDPRVWTLEDGYKPKKADGGGDGPGIYTCKKCLRIFGIALEKCPDCGTPKTKASREIEVVDGQLTEIESSKYYRCQHCEKRGKLDGGQDYDAPCPHCQVRALKPLTEPEPVLSPAEVTERRNWYFRAVEDAARSGFDLKRANVQYLGKFGVHAPKKWRDEAAQRMSESYEGLTA